MADKGRYAALKQEWEDLGLRGQSLFNPSIQHQTSSSEFLAELGFLHEMTGDQRFYDAIIAVAEYALIDLDGNWRRDPATNVLPPPELEHLRDCTFLSVLSQVSRGSSLRKACAETVVKKRIFGHSFEAVCKEVERLYRKYVANGEEPHAVALRTMSRVERHWPDSVPDGYIAWKKSRRRATPEHNG